LKLDNKRTILIGFAFLAISAFWQMYDNIIPLILKYFFNIGDTVSGAIMAMDNIFALIMLPVFGAWSDKVNHKRGKRTPFIFVGTIMAVVFMMILPMAANARNLVLFIIALFLTLVSMSIFRSPAVSLMPDVTPKPLRSKGNALINLMGAVGVIAALGMVMFLVGDGETPDYTLLFAAVAVIMIIALLVLLFKVDENKFVAERIAAEKEWGIPVAWTLEQKHWFYQMERQKGLYMDNSWIDLLPEEGDIPREKAVEIARDAIMEAFDLKEEEMEVYQAGISFLSETPAHSN